MMNFSFDDLLRCRKTAVLLLLMVWVGGLGGWAAPLYAQTGTPSGSAPGTAPNQQVELTVGITADPPDVATGEARIIVTISNNGTSWPELLLVRFSHPADTTVVETALAITGMVLTPEEQEEGSVTYTLEPPSNTFQQVRQLNVTLRLEPSDSDDPVLLQAEVLSEDGEELETAILDLDEQEMLAEGRLPAVPGTQQDNTPTPETITATATIEPTATSTTEPAALPVITQEPAATDAPVPPEEDDPAAGMNISRVLLLAVLVGLGLLVVLAGLFFLYRLVRRPAVVTGPPGKGQPLAPTPRATAVTQAAPPAAAQPTAAFLTLAADPQQRFAVEGERFAIGRAEANDLIIDDNMAGSQTVSRHHAAIYRQNGEFVIEDLNSQNGVWVNGRATSKNVLQNGWQVVIGSVKFIFHTE